MAEVGGWPAQGEGDLLGEFDWEFDSDLMGHPYIMSVHCGFLWTHPLCQPKYSTERQQKGSFSKPTHPIHDMLT